MHISQLGSCSEIGSSVTKDEGDNHSILWSSITEEQKSIHEPSCWNFGIGKSKINLILLIRIKTFESTCEEISGGIPRKRQVWS